MPINGIAANSFAALEQRRQRYAVQMLAILCGHSGHIENGRTKVRTDHRIRKGL
jgi:hypothetical protein